MNVSTHSLEQPPVSETKRLPVINKRAPNTSYFTPEQSPPSGTFLQWANGESNPAPLLFTPLKIRDITFQNRIWVSPMCQYSAENGLVTDWHLVQLGSYATRGASLIIVEATAIVPEGRSTPEDLGLWDDSQIPGFQRINEFIHSQGQKIGIQLQHSGRKSGCLAPWLGNRVANGDENGWPDEVYGPSDVGYNAEYPVPKEMTIGDIEGVVEAYARAAERAVRAGFDVIEVHAAHGYLLHSFMSPRSNTRTDTYGGSLENRIRLSIQIVRAIRAVIPTGMPLFFRLSATDCLPPGHGWEVTDSIYLSRALLACGVDLIDVSSAGLDPAQKITLGPAYQADYAEEIKREVEGMLVSSVGMIETAEVAEGALVGEKADVVMVGREFSRNPSLVLDMARSMGVVVKWPIQLHRAEPKYLPNL